MPTDEPVIDDLTMRMVGALRKATRPNYFFCGFHTCICGAISGPQDAILPNGWVTNTLCVHYLAYHRAEVPAAGLDAVSALPLDVELPSSDELHGPKFHDKAGNKIRAIDRLRERYDKLKQDRAG